MRPRGSRNASYDKRRAELLERLTLRLCNRETGWPTMRELAAAANCSVSTLSHYFGRRQDVVRAVLHHIAVGTEDIYAATDAIAARGLEFMPGPPAIYYDKSFDRVKGHDINQVRSAIDAHRNRKAGVQLGVALRLHARIQLATAVGIERGLRDDLAGDANGIAKLAPVLLVGHVVEQDTGVDPRIGGANLDAAATG